MSIYDRAHVLKTHPRHLDAVARGDKTFEVRRDDRGYQVGDTLILRAYTPHERNAWCGVKAKDCQFTSHHHEERDVVAEVTYVLPGGQYGIDPDVVVLGIHVHR